MITRSSIAVCTLAATGLVAASVAHGQVCPPAESAMYEVTFHATWTEDTHPTEYPGSAHFSSLIGGTHHNGIHFWELGGIATSGIESMAESGATSLLRGEVNDAIAAGLAGEVISGSGVGRPPAETSTTFTVTQTHPLATIVSMIAPSPDWFVGVDGIDLFANGEWADEIVVDLYPYDAGTDSGTTYTSSNNDTNPQEPISQIFGYPLLNGNEVLPLGTFTFTRLDGSCLTACVDNLVGGEVATINVGGGVPGASVAVLYGFTPGQYQANLGPWCVDFGFEVTNPQSRVVAQGVFDGNGEFSFQGVVPGSLSGQSIMLQAAMAGTCPGTCMSNVIDEVVQ